ncbi:hypothetical protein NDU88_009423 [Pleurodeles waltl]|uniref:Uncharacterized protein n=1 Tax=Pleurodeles waltl TaxID=8319 RepID=A0AAV7RXI8_PLEWA|nr:hypothetical protein NDU88_009423 [Pleurodeles waltl]
MVTAQRGYQLVTRNVSWFKRVEGHDEDTLADAEEVDDVADHRIEPREGLTKAQVQVLSQSVMQGDWLIGEATVRGIIYGPILPLAKDSEIFCADYRAEHSGTGGLGVSVLV